MANILITLVGCDDETTVGMEVTEDEHLFLINLQHEINKTVRYSCMPKLRLNDSYGTEVGTD